MSFKDLLAIERPKFGTFLVEFATPGIGHLLASAGLDFVLLDLEHSGFGTDTLKSVLRYLEAAGLPAIVGMPSKDPLYLSRALDMGAEAVMAPMVASVAEARAAVARVKYPPLGERAVSAGVGHDHWRGGALGPTTARANAATVFFAKIETRAGVENAEAIAALDGIDGLWIGHGDLTVSLGIPDRYDHPTYREAARRVVAAAEAVGKPVGRLVGSVNEGVGLIREGYRFIGYSGDAWVLRDALAEAVAAMADGARSATQGRTP